MIENTRICVVDIGSNSVRVLITDIDNGHISRLYSNLNTTRLYADISEDGYLNTGSMDRTVKAVREYVAMGYTHGVEDCFLFATAAVRVAKNKDEFINKVKKSTGLTIDVIDEKREALLAFAGVGYEGLCGIIDIGGASTEIAIGDKGSVLFSDSFNIGAVKCNEILMDDDSGNIIEKVRPLLIGKKYNNLLQSSKSYNGKKFFGVGGTITTIAAMKNELKVYDSEVINNTIISLDDVEKTIEKLQGMSLEERKNIVGLEEKRADIIVFGMSILANIMKDYNIDELCASDNGNMVGYLTQKLKETS